MEASLSDPLLSTRASEGDFDLEEDPNNEDPREFRGLPDLAARDKKKKVWKNLKDMVWYLLIFLLVLFLALIFPL